MVKNPPSKAADVRCGFSPWRRAQPPTPVFLPGESHGQRGLAGCSPWGFKESDTTKVTHTHIRDAYKVLRPPKNSIGPENSVIQKQDDLSWVV